MIRTDSFLTRFDAEKKKIVNQNGSDAHFWKQLDTDCMVSPKNRRYEFYLWAEQNLATGEWRYYFHRAILGGMIGERVNEIEKLRGKAPTAAKAWYYAQK